ncbi:MULTISPECIES: PaaI family thioesterase [Pseudomonas]|uniref:PaaI family thioesterase n=1 Tax=Pseudomonas TaxID=286 RepID=UPI0004D40FEE|nr:MULTISPECIES: YiiD C-terminal domain-containing protein [Pseudomonas]KES24709.1 thioesterase [Pseudomonas sp. AAC]MCP1604729.1 acyl-coenzyme A thioesterase PaaI-like protein [Pseudomonas citronellolis]MCP1654895.1 acyl-coenzyme A thioesterase PaaI-like protein [Pseudomonas citronellolis]MCP1722492.1 acyl-coenzyme A thioesterase PaaI-like protein [Pseudomonas citronellolis]OHR95245.1 thioesterase [Pseudomonas sp. HMSC75E02]
MSFPVEFVRQMTEEHIAFVKRCGLKAEILERGHVRLRMPLHGNENHLGNMYAGALFTLAELPGGVITLTSFDSHRFYPIVKEAGLRFRRPAASDVLVEARLDEAELKRIAEEATLNGKAEYVLELQLKDVHGEVVAESRAVYQLRSR